LVITPFDVDTIANIIAAGQGNFVSVAGYFDGLGARTGTTFGQADSGIRPADPGVFVNADNESLDAFIFVDNNFRNIGIQEVISGINGFDQGRNLSFWVI